MKQKIKVDIYVSFEFNEHSKLWIFTDYSQQGETKKLPPIPLFSLSTSLSQQLKEKQSSKQPVEISGLEMEI